MTRVDQSTSQVRCQGFFKGRKVETEQRKVKRSIMADLL